MQIITYIKNHYHTPLGYAEVLKIGLPLVASMGSTTAMEFTDRLFLSRYSVDAIAAALPAALASLAILLALMGICGYSTVLIAQYVGSRAFHRVGAAFWQGIWCALFGAVIMASMWWSAEPLFGYADHPANVQQLEINYFRILTVGGGFALLGSAASGFFSGRGQTRVIMIANFIGVIINIPLDYLLIFGGFGIPPLGIVGAGIATACGWAFIFVFLCFFIFTKENEKIYNIISAWRLEWDMFKRLLKFGFPSGINLFLEMIASTWFVFEIGSLGQTELAATNIAFSINSLVFTPMLGLNMAVSALVGQAMGAGKPHDAEVATRHTLHLAFAYMIPFCLLYTLIPTTLIELFAPNNMTAVEFAPVSNMGAMLLYYIALYSLVDACGIIYFGTFKGAGDTLGIFALIASAVVFFLVIPIVALKHYGMEGIHSYWIVFTVYVIYLAGASRIRFVLRKWHRIKVVETTLST